MSEDVNKKNSMVVFNAVLDNKAKVTADKLIHRIKEGEISPTYLAVIIKKFEKIYDLVHKDTDAKQLIIQDVKKYLEGNKKTVELYGAKITLANAGGYWDYSNTDDPYLEELEKIHNQTKELIKLRKEEIQNKTAEWKSVNNPENIVNFGLKAFTLKYERLPKLEWEETIEVFDTNPPVKIAREQLRFSL